MEKQLHCCQRSGHPCSGIYINLMFCILSFNVKYLENNYPVADRDKPYHFKFAQPNGVLHMSLATTQQEGWIVHPSQDEMEVSHSL